MQAGTLKHRITLQVPVDVRTPQGGAKEAFQDWIDVWAAVEPLTPREFFSGQQVASEIDTRIRIRYRQGLNARLRVKWTRSGGSPTDVSYYDVKGDPIELLSQRREVHLLCTLRDAEGFRTGTPS